jgi:hypothetical protein
VFTARYALSPYIKQIRLVFKGLIYKLVWDTTRQSNPHDEMLRNNLTRSNIVLLEKPIVPQPAKISAQFFETQGSLSQPAICASPQPNTYSPVLSNCFFKIHFNIILSKLRSSKRSLSFRLPHQKAVSISVLFHECHMPSQLIFLDCSP